MMRVVWCLCGLTANLAFADVTVGSKRFTESYVLSAVVAESIRHDGGVAAERPGLGNTAITLAALESGAIDVYPEYTGTIAREILGLDHSPERAELDRLLAARGLRIGALLGFNNSYALAMSAAGSSSRGLTRLGQLAAAKDLRYGLSQEFIGRADGWPGLAHRYGLAAAPQGLDHGLAYAALDAGQIDVVDVYSTDAQIVARSLVVLDDDRHYFPRYDAVLLVRADLPERAPREWQSLQALEGRIDESTMQRLNAEAEVGKRDFTSIARDFVAGRAAPAKPRAASFWHRLFGSDFLRLTGQHVGLTVIALLASLAIGLPLGVLAYRRPRLGSVVLAVVGVLQTIPSLAMLAILIAMTQQIGWLPALLTLTAYGLLPIVRNTQVGLSQVPRGLIAAGASLGMERGAILTSIELPLAAPSIWAGARTAAVIGVGTATLAAFVGAGGYGERIVTGLALNDHSVLLAGAIPSAGLALLVEAMFSLAERRFVSPGLRSVPGA
ncbi:glycine betaine ABC transporter substrate-binding protein [soil metagenome]